MAQEFRHIVRIAGTDLDGSIKLDYGLARIKGLGINLSKAVVKKSNLARGLRVGELTEVDVQRIEEILKNPQKFDLPHWLLNKRKDIETGDDLHLIGSDLVLREKIDIDNMKDIRSWKGTRHSLGLKVRGQRTKTSGRTGRAVGVKKKMLIEAAKEEKKK